MGSSIFFFIRKIKTFAGPLELLRIMKRFNILLALFILLLACKNQGSTTTEQDAATSDVAYAAYGEAIDETGADDHYQLLGLYQNLETKDSITGKFKARVKEVCQAKGCWMTLDLPNGQETRVRFKDYGFFVPKDIAGQFVIVEGSAFLQELSVEEQQHYAEEAQTDVDPSSITEAVNSYAFLAHGVLVDPR